MISLKKKATPRGGYMARITVLQVWAVTGGIVQIRGTTQRRNAQDEPRTIKKEYVFNIDL